MYRKLTFLVSFEYKESKMDLQVLDILGDWWILSKEEAESLCEWHHTGNDWNPDTIDETFIYLLLAGF